jgi:hypothetical protein
MRQYEDLTVKDPRIGVLNLNCLRADCKMNIRRSGVGWERVLALVGKAATVPSTRQNLSILPPFRFFGRTGSNRFLEVLGRAECDLLASLDLDGLAGRRVASHAGGAMPDLQDAQAHQAQAVALLEVLGDETNHIGEQGFGLLLRHFVTLRQLRC